MDLQATQAPIWLRPPAERADAGALRAVVWLLGIPIAGMLAADQASVFLIINLVLLLFFWAVGISLHELAHVFMGRARGFDIHWFCVGTGPILWEGTLRKAWVELRWVPFSGAVYLSTSHRPKLRERLSQVHAIGPFVHLVTGGAAFAWCKSVGFGHFGLELAPQTMLLAASLISYLANLNDVNDLEKQTTDVNIILTLAREAPEAIEQRFLGQQQVNASWRSHVASLRSA